MTDLSQKGYRIKIFKTGTRPVTGAWTMQKRDAVRTARRLVRIYGAGARADVFIAGRKPVLFYQCHAKLRGGKLVLVGDEL